MPVLVTTYVSVARTMGRNHVVEPVSYDHLFYAAIRFQRLQSWHGLFVTVMHLQ